MKREQPELLVVDEQVEQASRAMKAMSHPLRLKILCVLGDKEVSVQDIVERVGCRVLPPRLDLREPRRRPVIEEGEISVGAAVSERDEALV